MNKRREKEKLRSGAMDAIVAGIAPAFIIGMIACLLFFLVLAFYRGQYDVRVMYILGLFTIGTVFIARIAIESGRGHANLFSFPLAVVSAIAMWRFVSVSGPLSGISGLVNIAFLGLAWFLADRITFDCTWISDRDPSHRQGLLQSLGLMRKPTPPDGLQTNNPRPTNTPKQIKAKNNSEGGSKRKKRHNPGVWVLYFAILAFPLFGLGQLAIPQPEQRQTALYFLAGYLGCALALLVTTSFLGMRRYLRQKGLEMPVEMSRTWLTTGIVALLLVLIASFVLPLPDGQSGVTLLPIELVAPEGLTTTRFGWGQEGEQDSSAADSARANSQDGPAEGPAQQNGQGNPDPNAQAKNGKSQASQSKQGQSQQGQSQQSESSQSDARSKQESSPQSEGSGGEQTESTQRSQPQPAGQQKSDQSSAQINRNETNQDQPNEAQSNDGQQNDEPQGNEQANDSRDGQKQPGGGQEQNETTAENQDRQSSQSRSATQSSSSWNGFTPTLPTHLAALFKWLLIGVLVCIVLFYVIRNPSEIARLWQSILDAIASLFGGNRKRAAADSGETQTASAPRPSNAHRAFHTFRNPFAGSANLSPEQKVQYTFAALEAWAREQGIAREQNQTAAEFATALARRTPQLGQDPQIAASMFDRTVFAKWHPQPADLAPLERLWQQLR